MMMSDVRSHIVIIMNLLKSREMGDKEEEEGLVTRLFNEVSTLGFCFHRK